MKTNENTPEGMVLVSEASMDAMADNIAKIAAAIKRMDTKLTEGALIALIQYSASRRLSYQNVSMVLHALRNLDSRTLKKPAKK